MNNSDFLRSSLGEKNSDDVNTNGSYVEGDRIFFAVLSEHQF